METIKELIKMKHIVFWPGVQSKDPLIRQKHNNFEYFEASRRTWEHFCNRHGHIFLPYEECSIEDTGTHRVNWQRWFDLFERVEALGVEYDKILLVDASTMVRWDCPDFLSDVPNDGVVAFRSLENLRWVAESTDGYRELFNDYDLDLKRYINSGFQIFGKWYKPFLEEMKKFYFDNVDEILRLQKEVGKGTDQPVMNYLIDMKGIKTYYDYLPNSYFQMHMNRFGWFGHNWQLKEDTTNYFLKYGNIWVFSGFDRAQRNSLMNQTWNLIKHNYEA